MGSDPTFFVVSWKFPIWTEFTRASLAIWADFFWILVVALPNVVDVWIEKEAGSYVLENIPPYENRLNIMLSK